MRKLQLVFYYLLHIHLDTSCNFIVSSPAYGSWSVYLRSGEQSSAKIEYSAFLDDKVEARVDNDGYLYLKVRRSIGITRNDLKAFVSIPKIEYIKASGASHIHSESIFEGKTNKIDYEIGRASCRERV